VRAGLRPRLASIGVAVAGIAAAAAAYVIVGGLPGMLYAAGIALAALVGAVAISAGRSRPAQEPESLSLSEADETPRRPRWKRKKHIIAELQLELDGLTVDLEEHRHALANLAAQRAREAEEAAETVRRLEARISSLEAERDALQALLADEQGRFEQTLEELGGGIGRHGNELAQLERELEALIAR